MVIELCPHFGGIPPLRECLRNVVHIPLGLAQLGRRCLRFLLRYVHRRCVFDTRLAGQRLWFTARGDSLGKALIDARLNLQFLHSNTLRSLCERQPHQQFARSALALALLLYKVDNESIPKIKTSPLWPFPNGRESC